MKVHILVTLRKGQERLAVLVFDTLRVGFPTADVTVHLNGIEPGTAEDGMVRELTEKTKCSVRYVAHTIHHRWITELLEAETGPCWILDGDVIFYSNIETWQFDPFRVPMAGALIPEFRDEFTKAITRSRLHTSLLYVNPGLMKELEMQRLAKLTITPFNPPIGLVEPVMVPLNGETYFYDTLSLAYHALGGETFTDVQKDAYFHFHFGCLGDVVLPHMEHRDALQASRDRIILDPEAGRGLWRAQEEYFNARQFNEDGVDVIAKIDPKDAEEARKWNIALCRGDESAMTFCDLWYGYCHGIDDLVDTLRDGRPRMSRDQMVSLFFRAALLYNSDFYIAHRNLLAPVVLQVTNTYRDSIAWERSPKSHLRQMGDVFRTCGNDMFVMVALLCGGEAHMREMSLAIKERDWLGQHHIDGRPM